jgi:hypothetical protein
MVAISPPGASGGGTSGFDRNEHLDHSVAHVNNELRKDVKTRNGTTDAAFSEYVVCITCGKVWRDHLTFGVVVVPAIANGTEAVVLGTYGRGDASEGRSAAWVLFDPTDDDIERAQAWFGTHSATLPSGRLVIEDSDPTPTTETPF